MARITVAAGLFLVSLSGLVHAQDVRGLEVCTAEKDMVRRTSCLQANVQFLQGALDKATRDGQDKLAAANRELAAQKAEHAAQKADIPFATAVGGNMPAGFYPRSPCIQPVPPENPAAARDREAALRRGVRSLPDDPRAAAYNLHVKTFNTQVTTFNVCIKTYMDNAQRDIQQIQSIVHAAVADGNAP